MAFNIKGRGKNSDLYGADDYEVERLYRKAKKEVSGPFISQKKLIFSALVLALGFSLFVIYQQGMWELLPFVPERVLSDEEISTNLSQVYGEVKPMRVEGSSMFPTFVDGQTVFVSADYYRTRSPVQDEVAAISFVTVPNLYIKRIVAVEGDSFVLRGGALYLNSTTSNRSVVIKPEYILYKQIVGYGYVVPNGTVIVIGDNPSASFDSRQFGLVISEDLSGKVVK